jgi:pimeloyl-ACP methyl ester carboxylesterase
MAFFALMHGGAHGGWCWEEVVPRLEALGHRAVAPDLPFGDDDGVEAWSDVVAEAVAEGNATGDDVVVVGHSLGGLGVPVVAERVGARHMVFLGAMVPVPGRPYVDVIADEPSVLLIDELDGALSGEPAFEADEGGSIPWAFAVKHFYQDLDEAVARRAWSRLRPQGFTVFTEPCPLTAWPAIPATYVLMTEDQSVNPEWSRMVARGRLGATLVELPGGHSPFYGRPDELVAVLVAVLDSIGG